MQKLFENFRRFVNEEKQKILLSESDQWDPNELKNIIDRGDEKPKMPPGVNAKTWATGIRRCISLDPGSSDYCPRNVGVEKIPKPKPPEVIPKPKKVKTAPKPIKVKVKLKAKKTQLSWAHCEEADSGRTDAVLLTILNRANGGEGTNQAWGARQAQSKLISRAGGEYDWSNILGGRLTTKKLEASVRSGEINSWITKLQVDGVRDVFAQQRADEERARVNRQGPLPVDVPSWNQPGGSMGIWCTSNECGDDCSCEGGEFAFFLKEWSKLSWYVRRNAYRRFIKGTAKPNMDLLPGLASAMLGRSTQGRYWTKDSGFDGIDASWNHWRKTNKKGACRPIKKR